MKRLNAKPRPELKTLVDESGLAEGGYIATKVLPILTTVEKAASIPFMPAGEGQRDHGDELKRAPGGSYHRGDWAVGEDTYTTAEYGIEEPVDLVEAMDDSDIFNSETVAAMIGRRELLLAREARVAAAVFNTALFSVDGTDFHDYTNWKSDAGTPWTDTEAAAIAIRKKCGAPKGALSLILADTLFQYAVRTTQIKDNIKYTTPLEKMTFAEQSQYLATVLGVKEIVIAGANVNGKAVGATAEFSGVWDDTKAMLALVSPSISSWKMPGLGRTPVWSKYSPDYKVVSYDDEVRNSIIIRTSEYSGTKVFKKFGFLLTGLGA
jgi:hypothetical protein